MQKASAAQEAARQRNYTGGARRKGEFDSGREEREQNRRGMKEAGTEKSRLQEAAQQEQRLQVGETLGRQRPPKCTMTSPVACSDAAAKQGGYALYGRRNSQPRRLEPKPSRTTKRPHQGYTKSCRIGTRSSAIEGLHPLFAQAPSRLKQARMIGGGGRARETWPRKADAPPDSCRA